jgi:hypothetical protein
MNALTDPLLYLAWSCCQHYHSTCHDGACKCCTSRRHLLTALPCVPTMTRLSFLQHILSFQLPPAAAGAHVTALYRLTEDSGAAGAAGKGPGGPRASGVGSPEAWSKKVYAAVQDSLRR